MVLFGIFVSHPSPRFSFCKCFEDVIFVLVFAKLGKCSMLIVVVLVIIGFNHQLLRYPLLNV